MSERVIVTLDVTMEEARMIADCISDVGPSYRGWTLPLVLSQVAGMEAKGSTKAVYLRSDASAALGGPDVSH